MPLILDKKLFLALFAAFIIFTVIGTLTHEFGHYIMAKSLGWNATIHYNHTSYSINSNTPEDSDPIIVALGGPAETMLTGSVGLLLILIYRKTFLNTEKLSLKQWLLVFFSLFWLREVCNFLIGCCYYLIEGRLLKRGDEAGLAINLGWHPMSIPCITALLGFIAFSVAFYFIPRKQRFTFLISLCIGALIGYALWLYLVGPIILP
jgi:hypothetical protein